ncbi:MAG: hypothetical protein BMS9Abin02_2006 [Anaerolineae bacterium]|nr:MAG: hypothetical protein BMS9Abin02_2006 [Anaerolineae bacterium]
MGEDKQLFILTGGIKTPPMSKEARRTTGQLLRKLQQGDSLTAPYSKRIRTIGPRCHELRIRDNRVIWRVFYRIDSDAIIVIKVFKKETQRIPSHVIDTCRQRLKNYDAE